MNDVVFVDVETTGLFPESDSVIQVAGIRTDHTGATVKGTFCVKVKPTTPMHPAAAAVNGYTPEAWEGALSPQEAAGKLATFAKGAEFAAHCVWFDHGFCEKLLKDNGVKVPWGRRLIDTQTLAHLLRATYPDMKGTNLQSCIEKMGGERGAIHDAFEDAKWAREVYVWAMAKIGAVTSEKMQATG